MTVQGRGPTDGPPTPVCELEVRREEGREQRGDKGREGKRKVGTWYIY